MVCLVQAFSLCQQVRLVQQPTHNHGEGGQWPTSTKCVTSCFTYPEISNSHLTDTEKRHGCPTSAKFLDNYQCYRSTAGTLFFIENPTSNFSLSTLSRKHHSNQENWHFTQHQQNWFVETKLIMFLAKTVHTAWGTNLLLCAQDPNFTSMYIITVNVTRTDCSQVCFSQSQQQTGWCLPDHVQNLLRPMLLLCVQACHFMWDL